MIKTEELEKLRKNSFMINIMNNNMTIEPSTLSKYYQFRAAYYGNARVEADKLSKKEKIMSSIHIDGMVIGFRKFNTKNEASHIEVWEKKTVARYSPINIDMICFTEAKAISLFMRPEDIDTVEPALNKFPVFEIIEVNEETYHVLHMFEFEDEQEIYNAIKITTARKLDNNEIESLNKGNYFPKEFTEYFKPEDLKKITEDKKIW